MGLCGAKSRQNNGAPCRGNGMANGRCRMHRGVAYKEETHGRTTLRAKKQRKQESTFIRKIFAINKSIKEIIKNQSK